MISTAHTTDAHRADGESEDGPPVQPAAAWLAEMRRPDPNANPDMPAFIRESMLPGVEDLAIRLLRNGARRIGIAGAHPCAGVSSLSEMLAQVLVDSGFDALHIDLARSSQGGDEERSWTSPKDEPGSAILRRPGRPALLVAHPGTMTRTHFHDSAALARHFDALLGEFEPIVVELAPFVQRSRTAINPVAAAAACDTVLFLCSRARTRRDQVEAVLERCRSNNVPLAGLVMNDVDQPSQTGRVSLSSPHQP